MKTIGYIFKYDEKQEKGILVYGHNHEPNWNDPLPIMFGKNDCIINVKTGQLVLFDLSKDETVSEIRPVSLYNFNRDVLAKIVSCYDKFTENTICEEANIVYENLFYDDFLDSDNCIFDLPDSIDEIYNLFGSRHHYNVNVVDETDDNYCSIDILDFSQWAEGIGEYGDNWYGKTAEEVLDLFEIFVDKRRKAYGQLKTAWQYDLDDSISSSWISLLSYLPASELIEICKKAPMLQPALPEEFAINNLSVLSIDYGFSSPKVCESFFRYMITKTTSTLEYVNLEKCIRSALSCNKKHKKEEGIQACQIGKTILTELQMCLDEKYANVVIPHLKNTIMSVLEIDNKQLEMLFVDGKESAIRIGTFMDWAECEMSGNAYFNLIQSHKDLTNAEQKALIEYMRRKSEEWIIFIAKESAKTNDVRPLITAYKVFESWISSELDCKVKEISGPIISAVNDLKDLYDAYDCNLLSEKQYLSKYKMLTKDYTIEQFMFSIIWALSAPLPISVQRYILEEILRLFDIRDFWTIEHVKLDDETIDNVPELIRWINEQCHYNCIDSTVANEIIGKIVAGLNLEDKQYLLDENIITSLSLEQNNVKEAVGKKYDFDSSVAWNE